MHPKTKETMFGNIRELYKETPLCFYVLGVDARGEMDMTYEEMITLMFVENIDRSSVASARTAPISNIREKDSWYRRSMEDLFLLSKHYVKDSTISGLWNAMLTKTSSTFCHNTGLRVFRDYSWCQSHYQQSSPYRGYQFSIASNYDISTYLPKGELGVFDTIEEFTTLLEECDNEVRSEEWFSPIGRAYEN